MVYCSIMLKKKSLSFFVCSALAEIPYVFKKPSLPHVRNVRKIRNEDIWASILPVGASLSPSDNLPVPRLCCQSRYKTCPLINSMSLPPRTAIDHGGRDCCLDKFILMSANLYNLNTLTFTLYFENFSQFQWWWWLWFCKSWQWPQTYMPKVFPLLTLWVVNSNVIQN